MRRLSTALAASALVATSALAAPAMAAPVPVGSTHRHQGHTAKVSSYVAMGDSYSATGIAPLDPGPAGTECGRSDATYSHLIAARLGVKSFRDAACGGADTSDYFHPQHADTPAQLTALKKSTQLVTMTIGGNDGNVSAVWCASRTTRHRLRDRVGRGAPDDRVDLRCTLQGAVPRILPQEGEAGDLPGRPPRSSGGARARATGDRGDPSELPPEPARHRKLDRLVIRLTPTRSIDCSVTRAIGSIVRPAW